MLPSIMQLRLLSYSMMFWSVVYDSGACTHTKSFVIGSHWGSVLPRGKIGSDLIIPQHPQKFKPG